MIVRSKKKSRAGTVLALFIVLVVAAVIVWAALSMSKVPAGIASNGSADRSADRNGPGINASSARPATDAWANTTVYFINVGQGDAELVVTPDGKNVLIDAGTQSSASTLVNFLNSRNVTVIDAFVLTHPDADHIAGADEVLKATTVNSIYHPGMVKDTQCYRNFIAAAEAENCPIHTDADMDPGDRIEVNSSVTFEIMAIDSQSDNANDASVVVKMSYGTVDVLFQGDASSSVEASMVAQFHDALNVEVLKVGHHGSSSSTSNAFLSATTPAVAVIEVGDGNTYGHPAGQALDRLDQAGCQVWRTDLSGTVTITTDGTDWAVSGDR